MNIGLSNDVYCNRLCRFYVQSENSIANVIYVREWNIVNISQIASYILNNSENIAAELKKK